MQVDMIRVEKDQGLKRSRVKGQGSRVKSYQELESHSFSTLSSPLSGLPEMFHQISLRCILLRMMIIDPARPGRQAHQNRFNSSIGLQAKKRPTVVNQIELCVAPPSNLLPPTLIFCIRFIHPFLQNGKVGICKNVSGIGREAEPLLIRPPLVTAQIVVEDTAHTPCLTPVSVVEIGVARLFEPVIEILAVPVTHLLVYGVKMDRILIPKIVGREIGSPTKPAVDGTIHLLAVVELKQSIIGVHSGCHRIAGRSEERRVGKECRSGGARDD